MVYSCLVDTDVVFYDKVLVWLRVCVMHKCVLNETDDVIINNQ